MDVRDAPRRAGAQSAVNHRHHRKPVPASEVDRHEGRHIHAPRVGFREVERTNANRVYTNDRHSYATPEDEAGAAILEQDTRGEFTGGDRRSDDDDDDKDPSRGGVGGAGGSDKGAAAPPEPKSDDDNVQEVPKNPCQALTGPHSKDWRKAMDAEIKVLESCDTWVLVNRAAIKGRRILSGKWVFRMKTAADCTIERFKARWVVRRYDQRHGIDFDQTFAPVSRHTSVRILLAIAAARHLPLRQIDVKNSFFYALVDAVSYVEQPHTYDEGDSRVCQLRKSLYVIKQAPMVWQQYLHNILLEIGFKQLPHDPGMHRRDFRAPATFFSLNGYVDTDHAADPDNRRSRTRFLFHLEPTGHISWNSQKQELVALSSAEAEFIAATATVREGLYLQEAKIPSSPTFRVHCDNQSAIRIANKPGFVDRTKHIVMRYFFVKDEIDKGKVDLTYCPTGDMAADFLTKRLPRQQYGTSTAPTSAE
ncbi:unnamed protein product [Closterium sp. NIES-54]